MPGSATLEKESPQAEDPAADPPLAVVNRLRRLYGAVAVTALLLFASFHPIDLGPLVLVALVPLLYVAASETPRVAALMSHAATSLFHVVGLAWIAVVTPEGWLTTAFLEGFYGIALVCGALWIRRRTGLPLAAALPPLGAALEMIRGNFPFIAFPWLFYGQALHGRDLLVQVVDLTSVYGLTFLALLCNGALTDVLLLLRERWGQDRELGPADTRRLGTILLAALSTFALAGLYGWLRTRQVEQAIVPGPRVMVVQVDIPQALKDSAVSADQVARLNLELTRRGLDNLTRGQPDERPRLDAIVWSETMWPWPIPDFRTPETRQAWERWLAFCQERNPSYANTVRSYKRQLFQLVASTGAPVLVGAMDTYWPDMTGVEGFREHNSFYCLSPTGDPQDPVRVTARYDKTNLVPASEYIPGRDSALFGWFFRLIKGMVPPGFTVFEPGQGPVLMQAGEWQLSPDICFEISFPELLRLGTKAGADVHVCPANDGWFVRGKGEHLEATAEIALARVHTRLRAIENRRGVVRCVNRGVSLVMDPLGRVQAQVERAVDGKLRSVGVEDYLIATVDTTRLMPLYVRVGNLFAWGCLLVSLGLGACAWQGRRLLPELPPPPEPEAGDEAPRGPDHGPPAPEEQGGDPATDQAPPPAAPPGA